MHACHVPVCQWEEDTPYFGAPTPFWSSRPILEISGLQLYLLVCLRRFINDLPYKSDEMAHVVFPDECYNKPKLTTKCRDGV